VAKAASFVSDDVKWPYGVRENREALDRLLSEACAQGIGSRQLTAEQLFA
jgi:hypothetical protein